jgi:hypothetical protein
MIQFLLSIFYHTLPHVFWKTKPIKFPDVQFYGETAAVNPHRGKEDTFSSSIWFPSRTKKRLKYSNLFFVKGKTVLTKSNKGGVTVRTDDCKYASLSAIPSVRVSFCRTDVGMNILYSCCQYSAELFLWPTFCNSAQAGVQFPAPLHHQQTWRWCTYLA